MSRTYHAIDADGHVLEPVTLWDDYVDPAFRDRAPRLIVDNDGKEKLLIEERILGSQQGMGGIGGVGARQGIVQASTMAYKDGRPGGFDPHPQADPRHGSRRHRRGLPLSEHGPLCRRRARPGARRGALPRL